MSTSEGIAVVRKIFEAVARRDPAGVFSAYHPKILIGEAPSLAVPSSEADGGEH